MANKTSSLAKLTAAIHALAGWRDSYSEKWIYHPNYGAFTQNGNIGTHAQFIEQVMGKNMSYGKNYDETERGYAQIDKEEKTILLETFKDDAPMIAADVINMYKKKFPGYTISISDESYKTAAGESPLFKVDRVKRGLVLEQKEIKFSSYEWKKGDRAIYRWAYTWGDPDREGTLKPGWTTESARCRILRVLDDKTALIRWDDSMNGGVGDRTKIMLDNLIPVQEKLQFASRTSKNPINKGDRVYHIYAYNFAWTREEGHGIVLQVVGDKARVKWDDGDIQNCGVEWLKPEQEGLKFSSKTAASYIPKVGDRVYRWTRYNDFFDTYQIIKKYKKEDAHGVVLRINYEEETAKVKWDNGTIEIDTPYSFLLPEQKSLKFSSEESIKVGDEVVILMGDPWEGASKYGRLRGIVIKLRGDKARVKWYNWDTAFGQPDDGQVHITTENVAEIVQTQRSLNLKESADNYLGDAKLAAVKNFKRGDRIVYEFYGWKNYQWLRDKRHGVIKGLKHDSENREYARILWDPGSGFDEKESQINTHLLDYEQEPLFPKEAAYAEAQNQSQHTDHQNMGMTKVLKSDPFAEEIEQLETSGISKEAFDITAANYDEMFKNILQVSPTHPVTQGALQLRVREEITWAKKDLKKQDRIVWWLRWFRLALLKSLVDGYKDEVQNDETSLGRKQYGYEPDALTKLENDYVEDKKKYATISEWWEKELQVLETRTGKTLRNENSTPGLGWFGRAHSRYQHYMSLPVPAIQNIIWDKQTTFELESIFGTAEQAWIEETKGKVQIQEGDEILVPFSDGWAWWKLNRAYCPDEARALGHCGNSAGGGNNPDERILSLRRHVRVGNTDMWEPHLTFILEPNGYLGEMKGKGNQKPAPRYHPYIIALLESPHIKGIRGGGYLPSHNFDLNDLTPEQQEAIVQKNPNLMKLSRRLKEQGATEDVIQRIHNVLWNPDEEHYGNINDPKYDPKLKGWKTNEWKSVDDFIEDWGDETAKYVQKQFSGDGDMFDWEFDTDWTSALEDLDQKHLDMVHNYIMQTHPEEVKEWQEENEEELDAGEQSLKTFIEDKDPGDVQSFLNGAARTGSQYGAEHEMYESLNSAVKSFGPLSTGEQVVLPTYKHMETKNVGGKSVQKEVEGITWDSPVYFYLPLEQAAILADKGEPWSYYEDENNRDEDEKIDVDQPYYGWSGWDRDAMQEEVKENFYIEPPKPVLTKPTKKKTKPKIKSKVRKSSLLNKQAQEPWHQREDDYTGRWNEDETEEQSRARYQKSQQWQQSALAAMSIGKLTPEQAHEVGLYEWNQFKLLPSPLYHVTTAKSKVLAEGLKSRNELGMDQGAGLGGGTEMSVSFTTDIAVGIGIYENMLIARKVAAGEMSLDELIDTATQGTGANKPWIADIIRSLGDEKTLDAIKRGVVQEQAMGRPPDDPGILPQYRKPGPWTPTPWAHHWMGGDGEKKYTWWERPMTDIEKKEAVFDFFKKWSFWREHAGGGLDPLYFCSDCHALGRVPESEIALLEYRAMPNARGVPTEGLSEWRIFSGAAVEFVKEVKNA
jgi:hypothetical protein